MTQFEWKENLMGKEILVQTVLLPQGIHIGIYGGDLPHIGAVSIADPEGTCMTTQFPGHKDGIISSRWVQELARKKLCPAVVEVGIHYDRISDEGIRKVIALSEKMLSTVLKVIERRKSTGTVLIDYFYCFGTF